MKKSNISLFFKLATPFSLVFLISFILVSHSFNQRYDAQIDLSFVPKTIYTVEKVSKTSAIKISSKVSDIKKNYKTYKQEKELAEKLKLEKEAQELLNTQKSLSNSNNSNSNNIEKNISPNSIYDFKVGKSFQYMSQHDPRWKNISFGNGDSIDIHGCGPTSVAMLVTNLTSEILTPEEAAFFTYDRNLYIPGSGSSHSIFLKALPEFGIKTSAFTNYSEAALKKELQKGNMFAVLMKNGTFSSSTGHFILILGIDQNGRAIIADSNSVENSKKTWDLKLILNEAKYSANSGGPFWLINNPL
ncbi:MAG: C39 family peptidase [Proteocatella sp.]